LTAQQSATQIGRGLQQLADEAATLPIGAIVLVSDGADNAGGIDLKTMTELQRRRLPVNTIGFGKTELSSDVELDGSKCRIKRWKARVWKRRSRSAKTVSEANTLT